MCYNGFRKAGGIDLNSRIKELRTTLRKSQEEFGKYLGLSKSGVSEIEAGRRSVTEQHIIMLKNSDLNVNEEWLRTGEGEMFNELDMENELMAWAGKVLGGNASFKKRFVRMLMSLSEDEWEFIAQKAKELVDYKE